LAERHDVTVVTARYRGARRRVEEGVTYRPMGLPFGYHASVISYHLAMPFMLLVARPDLVVEDFAAPMSSTLAPLWTNQPTIALVQWLFAAETSERYGVPFYLFERWGVRLHQHFVAVSRYMADELRAANPSGVVDLVYAGVDAPSPVADRSSDGGMRIVYLGRLQKQAKGLDLLVKAFTRLSDLPDAELTIAGDGPYAEELRALIARLGVAERARLIGRVEDDAKERLLEEAAVVAIPSRFESFGLVAAEALARGVPVVGFALPSLQEIVTPECGILVPCFDVERLREALHALLRDPDRRREMGAAGRRRAARFRWSVAAEKQERSYRAAVAGHERRSVLKKLRRIRSLPPSSPRSCEVADATDRADAILNGPTS
jgi:glycosyltransferase involved in cell wall biosynthesis